MTNTQLRALSVKLHAEMHQEIYSNCQRSTAPATERYTGAIAICEKYLERLYEAVEGKLEEVEMQVLFFRSIKPLFVCEREYYARLYYAALFAGEAFYERELERMQGLLLKHKAFSDYYYRGETHRDSEWFCTGQVPEPTLLCLQPVETNLSCTSTRDGWVGGLLAVERYLEWLKRKITRETTNAGDITF